MKAGPERAVRIGVDIGGTFTDLQVLDEVSGQTWEFKVQTTPHDYAEGLAIGLKEASAAVGFDFGSARLVVHGTTIATNAVLQRRFPPCALVTTQGFEDVIEIGRHMRRQVYGLYAEDRPLLIPRSRRFGVPERIAADGSVIEPLDEEAVRGVGRTLRRQGIGTAAVCLLHAYRAPAHERRIAELLREECGPIDISVSSDVSPEIREYERVSTTVLSALLLQTVREYMASLELRLEQMGLHGRLLIIQSNGGACGLRRAGEHPASLLLSGPCGGALGVERIAARTGIADMVGMDMGGTSLDVSVVVDGRATIVAQGMIDGLPVRLPMVDVQTVGTGGGSIAYVDRTGRLRVGPASAGAVPGPACYAHGGTDPTVTDANVVLGRLDPNGFAGGRIRLDRILAEQAVESAVALPLGLSLEAAAEGIITVAVADMRRAVLRSLSERGLDPASFCLAAFGGAAGLHAVLVAEQAGLRQVIFPRSASTLSAYGFLSSDVRHDLSRTVMLAAEPGSLAPLAAVLRELRAEGEALLERDGMGPALRVFEFLIDCRYAGQGSELAVPVTRAELELTTIDAVRHDFDDVHRRHFAHADPGAPVEFVTVRLRAIGRVPRPREQSVGTAEAPRPPGLRRVFLADCWHELQVLNRASLIGRSAVAGPFILEEPYSTVLVPAGWEVTTATSGDILTQRVA